MFVSVSREASECRLYAEHCADKARLQSEPQLRQEFLDMQQRWLSLARCYEFSERLEFLSAIETRNEEARSKIQEGSSSRSLRTVSQSAARIEPPIRRRRTVDGQ
jgi:hypothetical protein